MSTVALPSAPAFAHGYFSSPASRQAQCARGVVSCGDIKWEPQSVEGPKGLRSCNGGVARLKPTVVCPSRLSANTVPPCSEAMALTIDKPRP